MITDNNFTEAELDAAAIANPAVLDQVKAYLTKKEYALMSKDEKTTYETNLETRLSEERTKRVAPIVEKYVKETSGIEKNEDEKYYKYQERALKTLAEQKADLAEQVKTFKASSNLNNVEREQLENLLELQKKNKKEVEQLKTNSALELGKARLENEIVRQMNTVSPKLMKSDIAGLAKAQEILSNSIFAEMQDLAQKDSRGAIILMRGDRALTNEDGSFKTVHQYYEEKMEEAGFFDNGKKQEGAGGNGGKLDRNTAIPGNCKTQSELLDWLKANTMKGKSQPELVKEFDKYGHLLPR